MNPTLWPLVQTTLNVMRTSKRLEKALSKTNGLQSKFQTSNLKAILKHAKFTAKPTPGGSTKCGDKSCGTCPYLQETSCIAITSTGEKC